LISAITKRLI